MLKFYFSSFAHSQPINSLFLCLCPTLKIEWFPGWQQNENYNRQPNDDGLSKQDCVEIRRHFNRPLSTSASSSLTDSFMWNDRDCATENSFLCERPLIDGRLIFLWFLPTLILLSLQSRARKQLRHWRLQQDNLSVTRQNESDANEPRLPPLLPRQYKLCDIHCRPERISNSDWI